MMMPFFAQQTEFDSETRWQHQINCQRASIGDASPHFEATRASIRDAHPFHYYSINIQVCHTISHCIQTISHLVGGLEHGFYDFPIILGIFNHPN